MMYGLSINSEIVRNTGREIEYVARQREKGGQEKDGKEKEKTKGRWREQWLMERCREAKIVRQ